MRDRLEPDFDKTKPGGTQSVSYHLFQRGEWSLVSGEMVAEVTISIFVNGRELATMMATPDQQEELAVGYLFNEGLIAGRDDVITVGVAPNRTCVDVWLKDKELKIPQRRILTSGCGKGVTFESDLSGLEPLISDLRLTHRRLASLMHVLQENAVLYHRARGIHAAGLATGDQVVMVSEDVGRHNTLDKLAGGCLLQGLDPRDHVLLTTGRISSEMINKARRMQIPLVASRSAPTSLAVQRAEQWHITIVGYLRPERMQVYSHPERVHNR